MQHFLSSQTYLYITICQHKVPLLCWSHWRQTWIYIACCAKTLKTIQHNAPGWKYEPCTWFIFSLCGPYWLKQISMLSGTHLDLRYCCLYMRVVVKLNWQYLLLAGMLRPVVLGVSYFLWCFCQCSQPQLPETTPLQNQGGYERWWWAEGKSVGTKCSYRSKARWISTHSIPSIWKEEEKNRKGEVRSYAVVYSKHFPPSWTSSH